jgi:hypothetical protein
MSSIGGRTVDSFNGFMYPGAQRPRTEIFGKEGVDGDGMHTLAMRGDPVEIPTVRDVASVALAEAEIDAYYAMIGTTITVVDQFGATWTATKVEACVAIPTKVLTTYRVLATWTFRPGV